jgi:hypothetical protein
MDAWERDCLSHQMLRCEFRCAKQYARHCKGNHLYVVECLTVLRDCHQMRECHLSLVTGEYEPMQTPLLSIGLIHKSLEWLEITRSGNAIINLLLNRCTLPSLRRLQCCSRRRKETVSITSFIQRSGCILEPLPYEGFPL